MSKEWNKEAHEHVFRALRGMLAKEPFYAHLAFNLPWVQKTLKDDLISTDGVSVLYDPDRVISLMAQDGPIAFAAYIGALDQPALAAQSADNILRSLLGATLTRIALRHPFRAERWGMPEEQKKAIASDSAIYSIVKSTFGDWPSKGMVERIKDSSSLVFEQIYDRVRLPPKPPQQPQRGPGGAGMSEPGDEKGEGSEPHSAFGNPMDGERDPAGGDPTEQEENIKQAVERASKKAKDAGKLPGNLMAELEKTNASKKDWREELRVFLGGGQSKEQSWSKPSRRHIADDIYLPGMPPSGPGVVVLAIDTSGSVDDRLLSRFVAEINKVNEDLQPEEIHVVCCDTQVQWSECFGPYDSVVAKPLGRGGTRFSPVFQWVQKMGIQPKALLYFTDLECSDFGNKPDYPVLWVKWPDGSDRAPPWGQVINMV